MAVSEQRKKKLKKTFLILFIVISSYFAWNIYPTPFGYNKWMQKTENSYCYYYEKYNRFTGEIVDRYWISLDNLMLRFHWNGKVPEGAEKI